MSGLFMVTFIPKGKVGDEHLEAVLTTSIVGEDPTLEEMMERYPNRFFRDGRYALYRWMEGHTRQE